MFVVNGNTAALRARWTLGIACTGSSMFMLSIQSLHAVVYVYVWSLGNTTALRANLAFALLAPVVAVFGWHHALLQSLHCFSYSLISFVELFLSLQSEGGFGANVVHEQTVCLRDCCVACISLVSEVHGTQWTIHYDFLTSKRKLRFRQGS